MTAGGAGARSSAPPHAAGDAAAVSFATSSTTPVAVPGLDGHAFVDITARSDHTCALKAAGEVFCWGCNNRGQLGLEAPGMPRGWVERSAGQVFTRVFAGGEFTCGIADVGSDTGQAYCWGEDGIDHGIGAAVYNTYLPPVWVAATR